MTGFATESALAFSERRPEATRTRLITWQDPLESMAAGAGMSGLAYMQAIAAGEIPPPPIAVTLNFAIVEVEHGRAVFEGEPGEEHYNPIGVVHGGYAATLLDSALGCAVHSTLEPGVAYTTLSLEAKFVRAITRDNARIRAEADVVHRSPMRAAASCWLTPPQPV